LITVNYSVVIKIQKRIAIVENEKGAFILVTEVVHWFEIIKK